MSPTSRTPRTGRPTLLAVPLLVGSLLLLGPAAWGDPSPRRQLTFAGEIPTFEAFQLALEASEVSGGAFDVTVGPLVEAWGFGPGGRRSRQPSEEELRELLGATGYRGLELDASAQTIRKKLPEIYCDLSGVAKGYGVDRVAAALDRLRADRYMIEVGGEIRTRGRNLEGRAWQLAIESPTAARAVHRVVSLSGAALATSGDYRNHHDLEGSRVSHTIDPRVGRPVEHSLASVSVVHSQCALADAFATALMVLGPDQGWRLAVRENLATLFLIRDSEAGLVEKMTPAFDELYSEVRLARASRRGERITFIGER
ncbi:MAG: FAD:protein FMN transferase [bacterium]|nr:FAD:protein FMN transferase [bacterium]